MYGQAQVEGGIVVDTSSLRTIHAIHPDRVEVEAGVLLHDLLQATLEHGLTLPVLPTGLVAAGLAVVNGCHAAGFHPDTVNVMAMDYGSANDNGGNMLLSAQQAAQATRNQTGDMIGITPMIGINDTNTEFFTLANATDLVNWARGQSYINRLAFWSLARDNGSCPNQGFASPVCSGIAQSTWQFSSIFRGF